MTETQTDHALMQRIARKDMAAYRILVGRHLNMCVRFAQRLLGNRQDAEDIVQNIYMKIWNDANCWQPSAKFTTWLYRVIMNACIDHKRKFIRIVGGTDVDMEYIVDETPGAEELLLEKQRSKRVQHALSQLNDQQRAAVVLSYYEGLSNQEAADALSIKLGAYQQLLFRARNKLRSLLTETQAETANGQ